MNNISTRVEETRAYFQRLGKLNIETLLKEISVKACSESIKNFDVGDSFHTLNSVLDGWYSVSNELGVIAYFGTESEAKRHKLDYINRVLNR